MSQPFVISMRIDGSGAGAVAATDAVRRGLVAVDAAADQASRAAKALDIALADTSAAEAGLAHYRDMLAAIRAEQVAETVRFKVQINDTGRNQSLARLAALGRDAAAATQALTSRERELAEAQRLVVSATDAAAGANDNLVSLQGRAAASATEEVQRLKAQYDPLFAAQQRHKATTAEIARAHQLGAISADQMTKAVARTDAQLEQEIATLRRLDQQMDAVKVGGPKGFQTANIAAQFQDIAVSAQMGMAPLQVALQQGTQLSSALAGTGGGLAGAISALGAGFASLLSPVSLATIAIVGLGTAGIQALMGLAEDAGNATDALERHKEWLDKVLTGYDDIKRAADQAAEASQKLPQEAAESELGAGRKEALNILEKQLQDIRAYVAEIQETAIDIPVQAGGVTDLLVAMQDVLDTVTSAGLSAETSSDQFAALITTLTQVKNSEADENVRAIAGALLDMVLAAQHARGEVDRTTDSLRLMGIEVDRLRNTHIEIEVTASTDKAIDAIARLKALEPDLRTPYEKAEDDLHIGLGAPDAILRLAAQEQFNKTTAALKAQEAAKAALAGSKAGASALDTWGNSVETFKQQTAALELQTKALSMSSYEAARARAEMDLLNDAQRAGIAVTPELRNQIAGMAEDYANAQVTLEKTTKTIQEQKAEMAFYKGVFSSFFTDLRGSLVEGQSLWEALGNAGANALGKIADRALSMAADGIFDMIFSAFGSAVGGGVSGFGGLGNGIGSGATLGGLQAFRGFDVGGWTGGAQGQPAGIVHGQEFVVKAGPAAANRSTLEAMNRGESFSSAAPTIVYAPNFAGLNGVTRSEIEAAQAASFREFEAAFPALYRDAVRRAKI